MDILNKGIIWKKNGGIKNGEKRKEIKEKGKRILGERIGDVKNIMMLKKENRKREEGFLRKIENKRNRYVKKEIGDKKGIEERNSRWKDKIKKKNLIIVEIKKIEKCGSNEWKSWFREKSKINKLMIEKRKIVRCEDEKYIKKEKERDRKMRGIFLKVMSSRFNYIFKGL